MRLIRFLFICLAGLAAALVLAIVLAFSPPIQNWLGNRLLGGLPGVQGTAESASVGWSSVEYTNLQLQRGTLVLTAPDVTVDVPAKQALFGHASVIHRLVAKGWTIGPVAPARGAAGSTTAGSGDAALHHADAAAAAGDDARAQLQRLVRELRLGNATIEQVDLEGDVIIPTGGDNNATVHGVVKGGGLAPGHAGRFTIDAATRAGVLPLGLVSAQGQLSIGAAAERRLNRLEFSGNVVAQSGVQPLSFGVRTAVTIDADAGDAATYEFDLRQGTTPVVALVAKYDRGAHRLTGTWKTNLPDTELARWLAAAPVQVGAAQGAGHFDADPQFASVHATGTLAANPVDLRALSPALARVPPLRAEAQFEATRQGGKVTVSTLSIALAGERPAAVVKALQPFAIDLTTGHLTAAASGGDLLALDLAAVPVAWLPELPAGLTLSGGDAHGAFTVSEASGTTTVRANAPVAADAVTLSRAAKPLLSAVNVAATVQATYTAAEGWRVEAAPLQLTTHGRPLATLSLRSALRPDEYQRVAVTGNWQAELDALRRQPGFGPWLQGRSAGGDFSAHLGAAADLTTNVHAVGADPTHVADAVVTLAMDDYQSGNLRVPLKLKLGAEAGAMDIEGTWNWAETPHRIDIQIGSSAVSTNQLRFVFGGVPLGVARDAHAASDARPFWSAWAGALRFQFAVVRTDNVEFNNVAGAFEIDRDAIRLKGGRAMFVPQPAVQGRRQPDDEFTLEPRTAFSADGALTFHAGVAEPYRLELTASADEVDAKRLFGAAATGADALIEGHWAVADKITSVGANFADLVARRQDQFHLTSKGGAFRLLKVNVASALPDAPTPVSDSFAKVGSAMGAIFGHHGQIAAENKLSKPMEAVLNFTYQSAEIPYQSFDIVANRAPDGGLRIDHFEVAAPDEHLTGSGKIGFVATNALSARPLTLDVALAVKGVAAERLATAGLLSKTKDALGYTELNQPIHFGGSLQSVDRSQWQSLLAHAAIAASSK